MDNSSIFWWKPRFVWVFPASHDWLPEGLPSCSHDLHLYPYDNFPWSQHFLWKKNEIPKRPKFGWPFSAGPSRPKPPPRSMTSWWQRRSSSLRLSWCVLASCWWVPPWEEKPPGRLSGSLTGQLANGSGGGENLVWSLGVKFMGMLKQTKWKQQTEGWLVRQLHKYLVKNLNCLLMLAICSFREILGGWGDPFLWTCQNMPKRPSVEEFPIPKSLFCHSGGLQDSSDRGGSRWAADIQQVCGLRMAITSQRYHRFKVVTFYWWLLGRTSWNIPWLWYSQGFWDTHGFSMFSGPKNLFGIMG